MARYSEKGVDYRTTWSAAEEVRHGRHAGPAPILQPGLKPTRIGVIYFGSTTPAMHEALDRWRLLATISTRCACAPSRSARTSMISFTAHDRVFVVEQNRDAQMRTLLMNEGGIDPARLTCHPEL
jgi:2-oxoglutarate ferredoxin oxidoreductase subunit alpha